MPKHDGTLWPTPDRGRTTDPLFPDRTDDAAAGDVLIDERPPAPGSRHATGRGDAALTRRAVAVGGAAGVAVFLAGCQPALRRVQGAARRQALVASPPVKVDGGWGAPGTASPTLTPTATPTPSVTPTATPTVTPTATVPVATVTAPAVPPPAPAPPVAGLPSAELLVARATYGATAGDLERARTLGVEAWLDEQLAAAGIADAAGDALRATFPDLMADYADLRKREKLDRGELIRSLQRRAVGLAAWSSRQLFEVLVDFWSNHLNVSVIGDDDVVLVPRPHYDETVIRANVLGRFADMLAASGLHPSMLRYLNLDGSTKDRPNENYAREIMELHTLGVDGGYTEDDVKALALLLTGWRINYDDGFRPRYNPGEHYVGPLTVAGRTFANPAAESGPAMWTEVVDFLSHHPSTAKFLATKLARHFVADEPSVELVDRLAATYLANDTAIAPVVRELLLSPEFASSAGAKLRRPYERYVSTVRALVPMIPAGAGEDLANATRALLDRLPAQRPYAWSPPDGYPDRSTAWTAAGTALDLFNSTARLVRGDVEELGAPGVAAVIAGAPTGFADVAIAATRQVLLRDPTDVEIDAVVSLLSSGSLKEPLSGDALKRAAEIAVTLLLVSPAHLVP